MSEITKVEKQIGYLQLLKKEQDIICFVWVKEDAEQITEQSITDEEWSQLAYTITRKADWIYNEMAEEITERLQLMREHNDRLIREGKETK